MHKALPASGNKSRRPAGAAVLAVVPVARGLAVAVVDLVVPAAAQLRAGTTLFRAHRAVALRAVVVLAVPAALQVELRAVLRVVSAVRVVARAAGPESPWRSSWKATSSPVPWSKAAQPLSCWKARSPANKPSSIRFAPSALATPSASIGRATSSTTTRSRFRVSFRTGRLRAAVALAPVPVAAVVLAAADPALADPAVAAAVLAVLAPKLLRAAITLSRVLRAAALPVVLVALRAALLVALLALAARLPAAVAFLVRLP